MEAMVFGVADYAASLQSHTTSIGGADPNYAVLTDRNGTPERDRHWGDQWHYALSRIAVTCRAHGLRPIDGPFGDFNDPEGFLAAARRAAVLGYEGKWAIHPSQIGLANDVFTPDAHIVDKTHRIIAAMRDAAANGSGAVSLDGRLIDAASIRMAETPARQARADRGQGERDGSSRCGRAATTSRSAASSATGSSPRSPTSEPAPGQASAERSCFLVASRARPRERPRRPMRFFEYEAREIVRRAGIPVTDYGFTRDPVEAGVIAARIGGPVVVKSQVLSGGRMKAGGIRFADSPAEAEREARAVLDLEIGGHMPRGVLVDPRASVVREFYAGVVWDGIRKRPVMLFSDMGGIDIEEVAASHPDHVGRGHFSTVLPLSEFRAKEVIASVGVTGSRLNRLVPILTRLAGLFLERDMTLAEINPLGELRGRVVRGVGRAYGDGERGPRPSPGPARGARGR